MVCEKAFWKGGRKMKKSNVLPSIVLGAICLISALLLSVINMFTAPEIEKNKKEAEIKALQEVLPDGTTFDAIEITNAYPDVITGGYKSDAGFVFKAEVIGYQPGLIIMIGVDNDGKIAGVKHTSSAETFGVEGELNQKYTDKKDDKDSLEMILSASASKGAPMTAAAYYKAIDAALEAALIANGFKTPEQILKDNCNAALGTTDKTFTSWFATEVLEGVTAVYVPNDNKGYVFVINDTFIGVNENGEITTVGVVDEVATTANAAYTAVIGSILTEVSGSFDGVESIYKTASGNYVLVTTGNGYVEDIKIKICITFDGKILASETVSHSETENIGGVVLENPSFHEQFIGADSNNFNGIENATGATAPVTVSGYKEALKNAFDAFKALTEGGND